MEAVYRLHQAGFRLSEVPIHFRDRAVGVSKIPQLEVVRGLRKLLQLASSRLLPHAMTRPSPLQAINCRACTSEFVSELPAESGKRMLKCLVCGASQPMS